VRIAVTTPTGHVGRHVTTMLIRVGVRPLLLARSPKNVPGRYGTTPMSSKPTPPTPIRSGRRRGAWTRSIGWIPA